MGDVRYFEGWNLQDTESAPQTRAFEKVGAKIPPVLSMQDVAAHNVGRSLIAPAGVPRPGCADVAARPGPPRSTEFPIPDDATMLLQISAVLQQLCDQNSDLRAKCPTIFDSVAKPTMSVHCYLIRIRRYTKFDSLCFLVALAYLRRLCEQHGPSFCPTHHNIHRLFITAVLVASKANDGAPRDLPSPPLAPVEPAASAAIARHGTPVSHPAGPSRSQTSSTRTSSWRSAAGSRTPS